MRKLKECMDKEQKAILAFEQMLRVRATKGKETHWRTGVDVYHWWMEDGVLPGQMEFEDYLED